MAKKTPAWAQGLSDSQQVSFATAAKKASCHPLAMPNCRRKRTTCFLKQPPKQKSGARRGHTCCVKPQKRSIKWLEERN